jgi:hypothetical protein
MDERLLSVRIDNITFPHTVSLSLGKRGNSIAFSEVRALFDSIQPPRKPGSHSSFDIG